MITIRKANQRGTSKMNWLNSQHTFSFADYHDSRFMRFGYLRVINEDVIQASAGFPMHPHRDMEIITYVVEGALEHKDSLGNGSIIRPGEIQRMSAGAGVRHSEFNYSNSEALHLLQIWILPEKTGLMPSYEQKTITKTPNTWILIGAQAEHSNAVVIHQKLRLFVTYLESGHSLPCKMKHQGWLQVIKGEIELNDHPLQHGDGVGMIDETNMNITCLKDAELLFFDME